MIWAKRICAEDAIPELFFTADKRVRFDEVMDAIDHSSAARKTMSRTTHGPGSEKS